jgi:hypothetical protein
MTEKLRACPLIPPFDLTLKWIRADVPDSGVVAIIDGHGDEIAYMECKPYKWRSSDVAKRLQALVDAFNRRTDGGG